jgi:hypothetical protein
MKKIILTAFTIAIATVTFAQQGPGHQRTHIAHHPRVNQVNKRIDNQESRIKDERKEGDLTRAQARKDRRNLRTVNQEKRDMRRQDHGHLTKADQRALNQQLDKNSKKIGQ